MARSWLWSSQIVAKKKQTNTERSSNTLVTHDVPRGSVLGPLLFVLFININGLDKIITNGTLRHFADDINLLIVSKSVKKITKYLNFRLSGQKIHIKNNVKYLGITIQDDLGLETHINNLLKKLRRSVAILSKVRHYTPKWLTRTIYYSLFNSHMIYGCQIWGQHKTNLAKRVVKLQEKAIKIINFTNISQCCSSEQHFCTRQNFKI